MNVTIISFGLALVITLFVVSNIFILNLLFGATDFLFGNPQFKVLKSLKGRNGFAFGFKWNEFKEESSFDMIRLRLLAPFSNPTQIEVSKSFTPHGTSFGEDLDMGPAIAQFMEKVGADRSRVLVEVSSTQTGVNFQFDMTGKKFQKMAHQTLITAEEFNKKNTATAPKIYYSTVKKSFIAEPLPESGKKLKLATNPEFAGQLQAGVAAVPGAESAKNYAVTKVWIAPGCIVCDACETIYPEVFDVQETTCIIRPGAPLTDGLRIQEAAEACPVEVIKFTPAATSGVA